MNTTRITEFKELEKIIDKINECGFLCEENTLENLSKLSKSDKFIIECSLKQIKIDLNLALDELLNLKNWIQRRKDGGNKEYKNL